MRVVSRVHGVLGGLGSVRSAVRRWSPSIQPHRKGGDLHPDQQWKPHHTAFSLRSAGKAKHTLQERRSPHFHVLKKLLWEVFLHGTPRNFQEYHGTTNHGRAKKKKKLQMIKKKCIILFAKKCYIKERIYICIDA